MVATFGYVRKHRRNNRFTFGDFTGHGSFKGTGTIKIWEQKHMLLASPQKFTTTSSSSVNIKSLPIMI